MLDKDRYNGWTNRATWSVALWLGNDEALYHTAWRMAVESLTRYDLANELQDLIQAHNPLGDGADVYTDLLGHALDAVNWDEIARHWWDDSRDSRDEASA